jgi:SAM-dependent methyltransferase
MVAEATAKGAVPSSPRAWDYRRPAKTAPRMLGSASPMSRVLPSPRHRFAPVAPLAGAPVRLLLTSATILFVELLLIRWIPANVKYIGYFSNFVLMASFLGIGLGIILGRRGVRLPLSPFPLLLLATTTLVIAAQLNIQFGGENEIFYGVDLSNSADVNFVVLPLIVVLVTAMLATLALPLGPLLRSMPPLRAYAIDIAGSMIGIAGFAILSLIGTSPVLWFAIVGVLLLLLCLGEGPTPWSAVGGVAMALVVLGSFQIAEVEKDAWSPYYRISAYGSDLSLASTDPADGEQPVFLAVDGIPHQQMMTGAEADNSPLHRQIYQWYPERTFDRVLVIGAGSGSDVALALHKGASHVDAVEIDPRLAQIGRDFHPEGVYEDPRVGVHVNDGRAFMRGSDQQYDLIVFALTDSLTLVSSTGSVRLESFIYTEEALAEARDQLAPDGVFVMYNLYREPWLVAKLEAMVAEVFGHQPLVKLPERSNAVLAAGPGVIALPGGQPSGDSLDVIPDVGSPEPKAATDDWPFLYLRTPGIASYYIGALAFLLLFAFGAVVAGARVTSTPIRRFSPHFFVLGVAFLLLETKSLVSFSLLFGTTWIVNALAFFAILASVLLAILVNARFRPRDPRILYAALFVAIAVAYLVPADALLIDPPQLRYTLAAAIAFAPVFFANLVFTYSFRDTASADMAFASNLLGAMVGGALEYVALLTGFQPLLLVVAVLYATAFLLARRVRFLADRELVTVPSGPGVAATAQ